MVPTARAPTVLRHRSVISMQPCEALRQALALSESMCAAGEDGRWERVHQVTQRRAALLRSAFSPGQAIGPGLRELLQRLAHCDQWLLALARDRRSHCESRVLKTAKARRGASAYSGIRGIGA